MSQAVLLEVWVLRSFTLLFMRYHDFQPPSRMQLNLPFHSELNLEDSQTKED